MISPTQDNIHIAGIKDGIVILKNGGYRLILQVNATNFALKSEEEQNSIIFQYQSFLNSLHFPIEIVMQSKKLDLTPYLEKIKSKMEKQTNELLRVQTQDYMEFVSKLINIANIMKKSFYVAVPYEPINLKNVSLLDRFFGGKASTNQVKISETEFKHHSEELIQRANTVAGGLGSLGLHCVQLNTEEIIEVFYKIYNPEIAGRERFKDTQTLTSPVVTSKPAENASLTQQEFESQENVIDNSALVEQSQKQQTQQAKIKEMQQHSQQQAANGPAVIENKAASMNGEQPATPQNEQSQGAQQN